MELDQESSIAYHNLATGHVGETEGVLDEPVGQASAVTPCWL